MPDKPWTPPSFLIVCRGDFSGSQPRVLAVAATLEEAREEARRRNELHPEFRVEVFRVEN
jgi:hypothetical protein